MTVAGALLGALGVDFTTSRARLVHEFYGYVLYAGETFQL